MKHCADNPGSHPRGGSGVAIVFRRKGFMSPQPSLPDEPDLTSTPTSASAEALATSSGFGPYRFLRRLGEGGMGEVWLAEQSRPVRRRVAVKIVKAGMNTAQVV